MSTEVRSFAPPDSCYCPPQDYRFYATCDVNGNCLFNGVDVSCYMTYPNSLQPVLLYRADSPPAVGIARDGRALQGRSAK